MRHHGRRQARSRIGKHSARVTLGPEDVLVAIKSYFDSSGKLENDWISLAGVAATDDVWAEFESKWDALLSGYNPSAKYIHMKEISSGNSAEFSWKRGWNEAKRFALAIEGLKVMQSMDKQKFRMFYCALSLKAHRKLRKMTYQMPEPVDFCNHYCTQIVMPWYDGFLPAKKGLDVDTIQYFFDSGEYFESPFREKWLREKRAAEARNEPSLWRVVASVALAEMKKTPGIQAADMIAWCTNREQVAEAGAKGKHFAHIARQIVPSFGQIWTEAKLKEQFKPLIFIPEGWYR